MRFRKPGDTKTTEFDVPATDSGQTFAQASRNFRFAAGVAMFGLELCGMLESSTPPWATIEELARDAISADPTGPRGEFSELIKQARRLCER